MAREPRKIRSERAEEIELELRAASRESCSKFSGILNGYKTSDDHLKRILKGPELVPRPESISTLKVPEVMVLNLHHQNSLGGQNFLGPKVSITPQLNPIISPKYESHSICRILTTIHRLGGNIWTDMPMASGPIDHDGCALDRTAGGNSTKMDL